MAGVVGAPTAASADGDRQQENAAFEEYASPDGSFALRYPANFKGFSKPLKTHKVEVRWVEFSLFGTEFWRMVRAGYYRPGGVRPSGGTKQGDRSWRGAMPLAPAENQQ